MTGTPALIDSHGRVLRDLRISVTDRCNFRCLYCLPETEAAANFYQNRWNTALSSTPIARSWKPKSSLLTYEEIVRVVRIAAGLGIEKIRLTGGEPLLRADLYRLVAMIAEVPGIRDLALTTNGFLFPQQAQALRDAGLKRVSFSCDSLDATVFQKMTGREGLGSVLESIRLARTLGMEPVKVNAVIIRGLNDHEIEALAAFARDESVSLRFIEFMPLDSGRAWLKEMVVPSREILARLQAAFDLKPVIPARAAETARRWQFADGRGEIGLIAPVSEPFCGHCDRIRLTADGQLRTCLFSIGEHDLRSRLRAGADDKAVEEYLREVVWQKEERHHIGEVEYVQPERSMSCIGG